MNDDLNKEILSELRRLRCLVQTSVWLSVLAFAVLVVYFVYARPQILRSRSVRAVDGYQQRAEQPSDDTSDPWTGIQAALDHGEYQKALSLAQQFIARQSNYHYSHATLGSVYVAMNDFTNAEAAYLRAVELYPAEEHEKALAAIRKRLARDAAPTSQGR